MPVPRFLWQEVTLEIDSTTSEAGLDFTIKPFVNEITPTGTFTAVSDENLITRV
ncbi:MAG TPA: hypothetical protein VHL11_21785 [Phototrophicaceae bacterium]|nr:hypothetical protein [Phototrophicaceae bacterium]